MSAESTPCRVCKFWEQHTPAKGDMPAWGFCLRYPPVPVSRSESTVHASGRESIDVTVATEWAETRANEWCGEFKMNDGQR